MTGMKQSLKRATLVFGLLIGTTATFELGPAVVGEAHAVIGRPLTPMSYAGVARRTTRRAVYSGAAYGAGAAYGTGVYGGGVYGGGVATLPGGCGRLTVAGALYYGCGGTYYQPMYDGPDVTYVVVEDPH
jgi:hypothetical protein